MQTGEWRYRIVHVMKPAKLPRSPEAALFHLLLAHPNTTPDWAALSGFAWWRAMAACPQDPIFHAEGDVATHTRMVVEEMQANKEWQALSTDQRGLLLLTALLHDVGKPDTTREEAGRITARGHSGRGEVMARRMLWEAAVPFAVREQVCALIRFHQVPLWLIERNDARFQAHCISQTARCDYLAILADADIRGRICADKEALLLNIACFGEICREENCFTGPRAFPSDHSRYEYFRAMGTRAADYAAYEEANRPELILLSGLPGSGKDTYVRAHLGDLPCVSLDDIRQEIGVSPTNPQEPVAAVARDRARAYLRAGQSVVWNATNLSREMRTRRRAFADDYRARVHIIYVESPHALQQTQNRSRDARVPENALERMYRTWELPDPTEAHTLTLAIRE